MTTKRELREKHEEIARILPVLPLRDMAIFPQTVAPVLVNREQSRRAVEASQKTNGQMLLLLEPETVTEKTLPAEYPLIGVVGRVLQILALPNGMMKLLVEGLFRAEVEEHSEVENVWQAAYHPLLPLESNVVQTEAARRHAIDMFRQYAAAQRTLPEELVTAADSFPDPFQVADFLASHIQCPAFKKQPVVDARTPLNALISVAALLTSETEMVNLEKHIEGQVRERINKSQRQYFLQEQLRQIKKELGENEDTDDFGDVIQYRKQIKKAKMPKEVKQKADEELERLKQMPMMSPEATVVRSYVDWLISLPWSIRTTDRTDIAEAERILNEDHYGLQKPKERILEYLSVIHLAKSVRGPILCFIGPPGVGKTSLGRSIARAMDRKFVRVSLGGIRDEAEIRGHRRTYVGSLPGRIIQGLKKAGSKNPVFLLDEIDKMAVDFRGDPASALLEALDPEQNKTFSDHYLEVDFDLSEILFITTANSRGAIPEPLLDRMELIPLLGYLPPEKLQIAKTFLIPRQRTEHGLDEQRLQIADNAVERIIEEYTREAGVRELERSIGTLCRKTARKIAEGKADAMHVSARNLPAMLGVPKFVDPPLDGKDRVGVAIGLAWTQVGGDVLKVQVVITPGKGKLSLTGQLGEVMKESGIAAWWLLKSRYKELGLAWEPFEKNDLHVHVPEGAVPKDGPSAGITLATALYSALSGRKVRGDMAMTGEVTLQGEVLPIGGLPEKLMAAKRANITHILIPEGNVKDLKEVPKQVLKGLHITPVKTIDQVWKLALRKSGFGVRGSGKPVGADAPVRPNTDPLGRQETANPTMQPGTGNTVLNHPNPPTTQPTPPNREPKYTSIVPTMEHPVTGLDLNDIEIGEC
ncbi:MAG: endopeptidase La [bacterium]|nr:endopeptidase La [bacterium]